MPSLSGYPQNFLSWLAKRRPTVRTRILKLNPPPLNEGAALRGYHPHRRSADFWTGNIGKAEFIRRFGAEAWRQLPRFCIRQAGHRKSVSRETILDRLWMIPNDDPLRRARRVKGGQWVLP